MQPGATIQMLWSPTKTALYLLLSGVLLTALVGCERDNRIRMLEDYDLAERYNDCLENEPTAPGPAQACSNLRRECERRKEELGTYICRTR